MKFTQVGAAFVLFRNRIELTFSPSLSSSLSLSPSLSSPLSLSRSPDFTAVMCTVCLVVAGPVMAVTGILLETYAKKGNGTPFSGLSVQLLQVGSDIGIILVFPLLLGWVFVRLFRSGVKVLNARTLARDPDGGSGVVSAAAIAAAPIKADPLRITLTALSRSFTTKYKYEEDEPASIDSVEVTSIDERQTAVRLSFFDCDHIVLCPVSSPPPHTLLSHLQSGLSQRGQGDCLLCVIASKESSDTAGTRRGRSLPPTPPRAPPRPLLLPRCALRFDHWLCSCHWHGPRDCRCSCAFR